MEVVEFGLEDARWRSRYDALFEATPDAFIQQSTLWAEVISELGPDRPIFLLCRDGDRDLAGLPLYLYEDGLGNILTSVPQPGPLGGVFCRSGLPEAGVERAYALLLERAERTARERRCLTLTIITNPFHPDLALYERHLAPDYVLENFTQYVPVDEAVVEGRLALRDLDRRTNLSRNLKRARGAGFSVSTCQSDAELEAWSRIHEQRHSELGAAPLDPRLFHNIRRVLEPRGKARLLLVKAGGEIASGCLYVRHRAVMDVFMLSMSGRYAEQAPNFLNTEQSLLWAAGAGVRIYNWQSSPGRRSGVYRYKSQWGSREAAYHFVTKRLCTPERLREIGREAIRAQYRWHYVVPFGVFEDGFDKRWFSK